MRAIIFSGPSLPRRMVEAAGVEWRPPVAQGDFYRAAISRPAVIGLVDGFFETGPTVWHKEILWAMSQGIHVYGAASIGALRAAELAQFGMRGVGVIFAAYRDGSLQDDDEVAVQHGPAELDYVVVTEAMVNVRATTAEAARCGVVEAPFAEALSGVAKAMFYKDRTWEAISTAAAKGGLDGEQLRRFGAWSASHRVDQKRRDAAELLGEVRRHVVEGRPPLQVEYQFAHTTAWEAVLRGTSR